MRLNSRIEHETKQMRNFSLENLLKAVELRRIHTSQF
jgi:hypothetical protein